MQAKKRRKNGEAREPTSAKQLCLREVAFGHNSALVCELASTVDHPFFWRGGQAIQIAATLTGVHIGRPLTDPEANATGSIPSHSPIEHGSHGIHPLRDVYGADCDIVRASYAACAPGCASPRLCPIPSAGETTSLRHIWSAPYPIPAIPFIHQGVSSHAVCVACIHADIAAPGATPGATPLGLTICIGTTEVA